MKKVQIRQEKERLYAELVRREGFLSREDLIKGRDRMLKYTKSAEESGDHGEASNYCEMAADYTIALGENRGAARLYTKAAELTQEFIDYLKGRGLNDFVTSAEKYGKRLRGYAAAARHEAAARKVGLRSGVRGLLHRMGLAAAA